MHLFSEVAVTNHLSTFKTSDKRMTRCRRILGTIIVKLEAWLAEALRLKAWCTRDEYRRLRNASKMRDWGVLKKIALEANQQHIRHRASMLIESEAFLTAVALNAWDIEQGQNVVTRVENTLLLRRISASARQDAVRLAAAEKLRNDKVLKQIALTTADLSLRWKVARKLNDPDLMADVALFKPSRSNLEPLRRQAFSALLHHLDELADRGHSSALLAFLHQQAHLPFKLEAFLRLSNEHIGLATLQYMARLDFLFISDEMVQSVFEKITRAGWHVGVQPKCFSCRQCQGKGYVLIKTVSTGHKPVESDIALCSECCGKGWIDFWEVVCTTGERQRRQKVAFKLPPSESLRSGCLRV